MGSKVDRLVVPLLVALTFSACTASDTTNLRGTSTTGSAQPPSWVLEDLAALDAATDHAPIREAFVAECQRLVIALTAPSIRVSLASTASFRLNYPVEVPSGALIRSTPGLELFGGVTRDPEHGDPDGHYLCRVVNPGVAVFVAFPPLTLYEMLFPSYEPPPPGEMPLWKPLQSAPPHGFFCSGPDSAHPCPQK